jgi:hypothetical protein
MVNFTLSKLRSSLFGAGCVEPAYGLNRNALAVLMSPSDLGRFFLAIGFHPGVDSDTLRFRPCLAFDTDGGFWDMLAGND